MQSEVLVLGVTADDDMIRLIETYGDMLLKMCSLILNDRMQAQDSVQETFIRARQQKRFQNEKGWLIRVAVNLCHDYHRSRWWKHIDHRIAADELQLPVSPSEKNEIWELVNLLPYRERETVILFFWNNMNADEIAQATGTSRASVYRRLGKAKKYLKLELEGEWQSP